MNNYTSQQTAILMLMTGLVTVMATSALIVGLNMSDTKVGACYQNKIQPEIFAKIYQRDQLKDSIDIRYSVTAARSFYRQHEEQPDFDMNRNEEEFLSRYQRVDCKEYEKTFSAAEVNILQHQILQLKLRGDRE